MSTPHDAMTEAITDADHTDGGFRPAYSDLATAAMDALEADGYAIVRAGELPPWMTEFGKRSIQDGASPEDGRSLTIYAMRGDL